MKEHKEDILNKTDRRLRLIFIGFLLSLTVLVTIYFYNQSSSDLIENNNDDKEIIKPIKRGDTSDLYYLGGNKFTIPFNSNVSKTIGPDFLVFQIITAQGDTFGLYSGNHPSLPDAIDRNLKNSLKSPLYQDSAYNQGRIKSIDIARKNGVYKKMVRAYGEYDDQLKEIVPPPHDSLELTLYSDVFKNIWVLQPPEEGIGVVDIAIEFNDDRKNIIHIFDGSTSKEQRVKMVEIAKSINNNSAND